MIPVSLVINKFKNIKKELIFNFPSEPGLYFIYGKNKTQRKLEGNGVGKSTIWDALCWCLFNKTVKGESAGDVSPWKMQEGNTSVTFLFKINDEIYNICRTWKPNTLTIGEHPAEEADVRELIGHTYESFLNSVIIGQDQRMFLDLKAAEKSVVMSEALQIDVWDQYAEKASKAASRITSMIAETRLDIARIEGKIEALDFKELEDSKNRWQLDKENKLALMEDDFDFKVELENKLSSELKEAESNILLEKPQKNSDLKNWEEFYQNQLRDEVAEAKALVTSSKKVEREILQDLENVATDKTCSKCGQPLKDQNRGKHRQELKIALNKARAKTQEYEKDLQEIAYKLEKLINKYERLHNAYQNALEEYQHEKRKSESIKLELESVSRSLDKILQEMDELEAKENPWNEAILQKKKEKQDLKKKLQAKEKEAEELQAEHAITSYWVKGFKDVKLFLISEALLQYEIEANSALAQLGLEEWSMEFDVDSLTKGGKVKRGFSVLINSPDVDKPVAWESWSGGEAQRLKLAAQMGLSNLISSSTGSSWNLEVYDEVSSYLSPQGIDDLMSSLRYRALEQNKIIFVIDHHTFSNGNFSGKYEVIKNNSGSFIQESDM